MTAAASGYVTERSEETLGERPCLRLACDLPDDEGTLYTTWYDQQTLLPLRSEISSDGTMVFEIAWTRFELTAKDSGTAAQPDGQTDGQAETEMDWTEADEAAAYAAAEE